MQRQVKREICKQREKEGYIYRDRKIKRGKDKERKRGREMHKSGWRKGGAELNINELKG